MAAKNDLNTILIASSLSIFLVSNLIDLRHVHSGLEKADVAQRSALDGTKKVEVQLDALAKGVNDLAQSGNPNARKIVVTLKQNGINIKSNGSQ